MRQRRVGATREVTPGRLGRADGAPAPPPTAITFVIGCGHRAARSGTAPRRAQDTPSSPRSSGSSARTMMRSRWLTCGSSPCARHHSTASRPRRPAAADAAGAGPPRPRHAGPPRPQRAIREAAASPGRGRPGAPTIGSVRPSRFGEHAPPTTACARSRATHARRRQRPRDRGDRPVAPDPGPSPTIVPSMSSASSPIGSAGGGSAFAGPDRALTAPRAGATRATRRGPRDRAGSSHAPARQERRAPRPTISSPGPRRSPGAPTPSGSSTARQPLQQPADDVQPVGPAVERQRRLEGEAPARASARSPVGDVRQVGAHDACTGSSPTRRQVVRGQEPHPVCDPVATAFSRARSSASRTRPSRPPVTSSSIRRSPQGRQERDGDRARPRPDVGDRAAAARPAGGAAAVRRATTSSIASSTSSSVSGRGISARASRREREAVELAEAADVGDGLAGRSRRATTPSNVAGGIRRRRGCPGTRSRRSGPTPSASPSSSSASRRGELDPDAREALRGARDQLGDGGRASGLRLTSGW